MQNLKQISFNELDLLNIGHTIQIAGAVWSGEGKNIVCLLPDEPQNENEIVILRMSIQEWERFLRQTDILETEILQNRPEGITKSLVRKTQRQVDSSLMWRVFQRDNYTCRYCGRIGVPLTVDHLVLWEEGGPTIEANLLSACKNCNKTRGRIHYEDWLKSEHYLRVSQNLPENIKQSNLDLVEQLKNIPTVNHIRNR